MSASVGGVFCASAQEATQPRFTARELFYDAAPAPKTAAAKPPASTSAPKSNVAAAKKRATPAPAPTPVQSATATPPPAPAVQPAPSSNGAMVIPAALVTAPKPASGTPLGLKYTILQKVGDQNIEVAPDTVFHANDRIQLSVQTNGPGYLYVIARGTSGTWQALFPSADIADGDNHVDGWNARVLPTPKRGWIFDNQTGTEQLFVVFSRTPEQSLEDMIYSLQSGAKAKNASDPDKPAPKRLMSASVQIPDSAVGLLRQTYTRDLIIEKVDEKTPEDKSSADQKEKAMYVVNPSGSADSRVVADIKLEHQ